MKCALLFEIAFISASISTLSATTYNCAQFTNPNGSVFVRGYNNAGTVSGYYSAAGTLHGFRRDASGGFTTIDPPGSTSTQLFAINNNGVVVGQYSNAGVTHFFTADASGTIAPVVAPAPYTILQVWGINDNGAISSNLSWIDASGGQNYGFGILNPDRSVTLVPGAGPGDPSNLVGSLNNARQLIETQQLPALADPSGNVTPIRYPYSYAQTVFTVPYGLNNGGFASGSFNITEVPIIGFLRDPSGAYSEFLCPNIRTYEGGVAYAINDNGGVAGNFTFDVLRGTGFVATPLPGEPQVSLSTTSLSFPATASGQSTPPQTFTITNTGNQRLDIGNISIQFASSFRNFQLSGCLDPATFAASLAPGASCTVTVSITPPTSSGGTAAIVIDDSAPGAPHVVAVTIAGSNAPPSCQLSGVSSTPPFTATFTAQDSFSGLQSIIVADSSNANESIPPFPSGTFNPVNMTATQIDSTQPSKFDFTVTNVAGLSTTCGTTFSGSGGGGASSFTALGGQIKGKAAVAMNLDGRLEAFVHGADDGLWHKWQNTPGGSWTEWESLGNTIASDPSVGVNADGRLEVFALGTDTSVMHIAETSGGADNWTAWSSLGGSVSSDIAVARNSDGRLEIFVRGNYDNALWHNVQVSASGTFSGWAPLGGFLTSDPVAVANADGRLDVFSRAGDATLQHIAQSAPGSSTWTNWVSLGGQILGDPAAILNADGRLEAFVRGADNALWHIAQVTAGSPDGAGFFDLGGVINEDPAVAINADGRLEAFVRGGGDNALWHVAQTSAGGSWGSFTSLAGTLDGAIVPVRNKDGRLDVFARFPDSQLWHITQRSPGSWN